MHTLLGKSHSPIPHVGPRMGAIVTIDSLSSFVSPFLPSSSSSFFTSSFARSSAIGPPFRSIDVDVRVVHLSTANFQLFIPKASWNIGVAVELGLNFKFAIYLVAKLLKFLFLSWQRFF